MLVTQLCLTFCDPMDCVPPGSSVRGILKARMNTGVGSHSLLQGISLTQESNPYLLPCRQFLYHLSPPGKPKYKFERNTLFTLNYLYVLPLIFPCCVESELSKTKYVTEYF